MVSLPPVASGRPLCSMADLAVAARTHDRSGGDPRIVRNILRP
jgi:hypothetical protein